jgi:hypothetical protein
MFRDASLPRIRASSYDTVMGGSKSLPRVRPSYSGAAFESSLISMGIPQQRARRLATEIRRGGAIVTVNAGSLNEDAERILERNHGRIRYEADTFAEGERPPAPDSAVGQIFGRVQRIYPGYVRGETRPQSIVEKTSGWPRRFWRGLFHLRYVFFHESPPIHDNL